MHVDVLRDSRQVAPGYILNVLKGESGWMWHAEYCVSYYGEVRRSVCYEKLAWLNYKKMKSWHGRVMLEQMADMELSTLCEAKRGLESSFTVLAIARFTNSGFKKLWRHDVDVLRDSRQVAPGYS